MFTREQCLALLTDRHIAVTANAGSGKTTVLVERYVRLLLEGVDVRSIVAITFTRKAAGEMRIRVATRLEQEYNNMLEKGDERATSRIRKLRERLNIAQISTIHSFCAGLLRNYPVEAKVNPLFAIIDEFDSKKLREDTIAFLAERKLQSEDTGEKEEYYRLFRLFGISVIQQIVEYLLSNLEQLAELKGIYSFSNEKIIEERNKIIRSNFVETLIFPLEKISEAIEIIRQSDLKLNADTKKLCDSKVMFEELIVECKNNNQNFEKIGRILLECSKLIFTNEGLPRKRIFDLIDSIGISNYIYGYSDTLYNSVMFFSSIENWDADNQLLHYARLILQFTEECEKIIESEKIQIAALDFNDVQKKVLDILSIEEVKRDIRQRFTYLMIDEFQDTNHAQFRLTSHLVQQLSDVYLYDNEVKTNLYVVGDPKQSIYRFRGADVRVFEKAKHTVKKMNSMDAPSKKVINGEEIYDLTEQEVLGDIRLTTTFRLMPEIAFFVNQVCGIGMKKSTEGYFVGYDETISSRRYPDGHKGSVQFIIGEYTENEEGELIEEKLQNHLLAKHLLNIVCSQSPLLIDDRGELRPVTWNDIVILGRKNDTLDTLATTLKSYGIPCHVPQGKRFYSRQEIRDIAAFITFLANPSDDFSLAVILRSPFFLVSDNDLLEIVCYSDELTLWEKVLLYSQSGNANDPVLQATEVLSELLPLSSRLSLPVLLNTIYEKTKWYHKVNKESESERKIANVNKLISFARDFEVGGFRGLFEFAERVNSLIENEVQESDALLETVNNSIPLITVHSSKGLEFPVVIVYDTNSGQHSTAARTRLDERFGIIMKPVVVHSNHYTGTYTDSVVSPMVKLASIEENLMERAELERLTYVALTRAKDHLIITANIRRKSSGEPNQYKGIFEFVNPILDSDYLLGKECILSGSLPIVQENNIVRKDFSLTIPIVKSIEEKVTIHDIMNVDDENSSKLAVDKERLLEPIESKQYDEQYSASKMMLFESDPTSYYLQYIIGLPKENDSTYSSSIPVEDNDAVIGTLVGKLLHNVLQRIPEWLSENGYHMDKLDTIISSVCDAVEIEVTEDVKTRILRETKLISRTKIVQRYAEFLKSAEFETQYYLPIDDDFYVAVFDCLVKNDRGEIEIWDWKTNKIHSERDMDMLFSLYKPQLEMYAVFASTLSRQESYTLRLLFTRRAIENCDDNHWIKEYVVHSDEIPILKEKLYKNYQIVKSVGYETH